MRDLYKRLGLVPSASPRAVEAAIARCQNSRTRRDAEAVLLIPGRRNAYDSVRSELATIGRLRARLGLTHSENWNFSGSSDFSPEDDSSISLREEFLSRLNILATEAKRQHRSRIWKERTRKLVIAAVLGVFAAWFLVPEWFSSSPETSRASSRPPAPSFTAPPVALPVSGDTQRFTSRRAVAPFEIRTQSGSHYVVKLVDVQTGKAALTVFVRGGQTVNTTVPLGTYRMKYAAGKTWYGYKELFGPNTSYNQADTTFQFADTGMQISGYTVTLYTVSDGNMRTRRIGSESF